MSDKSNRIEKALEYAENNGIDDCEFCRFSANCNGGVKSDGGGNPIFPPCAGGEPEHWVDENTLLEKVQEHKESEVI